MMKRLIAVGVLFSLVAAGQTERGNIVGVVEDSTGAAVSGAAVQITNLATNTSVTVLATGSGEYNAANLSPGRYRVEVAHTGFKRFVQDDVVLTAAATVRVDVRLQVGQVTETVEVQATAVRVQTENARITTAVQNKMFDELPLVVGGAMRSVFNLVTVVAEAKGEGSQLSLGGGQAAAWDATLDGLSVTTNRSANAVEIAYTTPSMEAITEFAVDTNGFKAEYGQAGGGVMTFVSKSGTNQFHGNVYNFFRNDALDARGFFPLVRGVYKQNNFGATGGGPVRIPKLYNGRDRTFFFAAYEGFRNRVGSNDLILSVPTPEMFQGDFRNWVNAQNQRLVIYDPATTRPGPDGRGFVRDAFPDNRIPENRFSQFARQVMPFARGVQPNRPGLVPGTRAYVQQNYINSTGSIITPTDKGSLKVDHLLSSRHRMSYMYNRSRFNQALGPGGPPGLPQPLFSGLVEEFDTQVHRLSYDWTISPRLLNLFSIGGNTFDKYSLSPNVGQNWRDKVCMRNAVDCNQNFPRVLFSEFTGWGGVSINGTSQPMWAIKDDLSFVSGKHTYKFGFAFQSQRAYGFGQQDIAGRADFSFLGTSVPGITTQTSGNGFASFLLGDANFGRTETDRFVPQLYRYYGFYAQDDWRVSRRLTVNLGVRYDFTLPPVSLRDEYSDFDPTRPNPAVNGYPGALRFAGFGPGRENTRSLVPGWWAGIGPRLGLAYALNDKTTVRAAYGRSFSKVTVVAGSGHFAGFIGQYEFTSPDQGVTPAFRVDQGLPAYPLPPLIDPAFSNNNNVDWWQGQEASRAPENNYWTLSFQRQIGQNTVLEAAYNGNAGSRLQTNLLVYNQVPTAVLNDLVGRFGPTQALNILRAQIDSPLAQQAGIRAPYPNFTDPRVQQLRSVAQALRPFPQFQNIVTGQQNGDKSGHSSYHALVIKVDRRFSQGLTFQWNYTLSKILTDSDTYFASFPGAMDHYNRRLEKSIGAFDQTHNLKFSTVYDLPFGKGKRWVSSGWSSHLIGGWRVSAIQIYSSGFPLALARNNPLPIFNAQTRPVVDRYDNWRAPIRGEKFDPAVDLFFDRAVFPAQPAHLMGNATRFNPKVRAFPGFNEDVSIAKSFAWGEGRRVDFRWESFNIFNRVVFANPTNNLNSPVFGVVAAQRNNPRRTQLALKIYW